MEEEEEEEEEEEDYSDPCLWLSNFLSPDSSPHFWTKLLKSTSSLQPDASTDVMPSGST